MNWQIDHKTLFMFMDGHLSTHTEYYEELYLLLYESANRIKWIRRVVVSPNSATNAAGVVHSWHCKKLQLLFKRAFHEYAQCNEGHHS